VVTLKGGESEKVSFTVIQGTSEEYTVAIGELTGRFTVKEPEPEGTVAEALTPEPPAPSTTEQPTKQPATTIQPEKEPEIPTQAPVEKEPITSEGIALWLVLIYVVCGIIVIGLPTIIYLRRRNNNKL
jgi:hypothetical protein